MKQLSIGRRGFAAGIALAPFAASLNAFAQALPKTLTFVVPNAPGGSNDVVARALTARLPQFLGGATAVVDNRAGAGGNVGSVYVAKNAPRDGSTWLVTVNSTQAVNPALYKNTGFDPIADFEPVAGVAVVKHAILASNSLPANNLADVIALARKEPGKYMYGSAGNGSFAHLLMEMFKKSQNLKMTHVPYKGVAPALTDLISGNLHLLVSTIPACLQFVKSGQVKALAVPSLQKSPALPNVPVAVDTVPGLVGELWVAVYAPKGVPRPLIDQVAQAVAKVQALPDFDSFLAAQGAQEMKAGPAELAAITKDELAKWAPIVKESGLSVD